MNILLRITILALVLLASHRASGFNGPYPENKNAVEIGDHCWYTILSEEEKTAAFVGIDCGYVAETYTVPPYVKFPDHGDAEYRVVEIGAEAFSFSMPRNPMMYYFMNDYGTGCVYCELNSASIPETVTGIGAKAFSGVFGDGFKEFRFPEGVNEIGEGCFYWSFGVEHIILPSKIKKIPVNFAAMCKNLKECDIPDEVEEIGAYAFKRCNSLEKVYIPASVKKIGVDAFTALLNIEKFEVDPANEHYIAPDGILLDKEGETLIAWPFKRTDVVIPEGVETMQGKTLDLAFDLFESIDLPSTLKSVPDIGFLRDTGLKRIYVRADVPPAYEGDGKYPLFDENVYDRATLYVPANSIEDYKAHTEWGKFRNIESLTLDAVEEIDAEEPASADAEYFTLDGKKAAPAEGEILIRRCNGKAEKVIL